MISRARYTISFLPSDSDLIAHLERIKENTTVSLYVRNLIKKDLNNYHDTHDIDSIVDRVLQKIKSNSNLQFSEKDPKQESTISEANKNVVTSLF
jgi:hypothetical protein